MEVNKLKIDKTLTRGASVKGDIGADIVVNETEDSNVELEFPFSSEFPAERWWGTEVLSHQKDAFLSERIDAGAVSLLFNHNWDSLMGTVLSVELKDKRWWAKVKLSRNQFTLEKLKDIKDGILRGVSFGYEIIDMVLNKQTEGSPNEYLATKWRVYEISFVTVPLDYTVGLGRSLKIPNEKEQIEISLAKQNEDKEKTGNNKRNIEDKSEDKNLVIEVKTNNLNQGAKSMEKNEIIAAANKRTEDILKLGDQFEMPQFAREMLKTEKTTQEVFDAMMEKRGNKKHIITENDGNIGLTEKEVKDFSIVNIVRAQMFPGENKYQEAIKFEREASEAACKAAGVKAKGILIPLDVLRHKGFAHADKRDLTVGSAANGGHLVSEELRPQNFIELLRKKSALQAAGATVFNGLVGNVHFPMQLSDATYYWVGEGDAVTKSNATFGLTSMSPKTIGLRSVISRNLLLQSSVDIENRVRNGLVKSAALGIDYAGLYGSGSSNEPEGLNATLGLTTKNFAAATPTFGEIVDCQTEVNADDADVGSTKYIINATMAGALKQAPKVAGYPMYILENNQMNGQPVVVSNNVASGDVWFGVWSEFAIGYWGGLDILVNPFSEDDKGNIIITGFQSCDVAPMHLQAFCKGADNP